MEDRIVGPRSGAVTTKGRYYGRPYRSRDRHCGRGAEIAALRQKLAAATARIQQEMGRHKATEADKDNAFKPFTWTSDKINSVPTLDDAWLKFCAT